MAKKSAFKFAGLNTAQLDMFSTTSAQSILSLMGNDTPVASPSNAAPAAVAPTAPVAPIAPIAVAPAVIAAVAQAVKSLGKNFYFSGDRALPANWTARAESNLAAIALADDILQSGRVPTRAEQETLSLFTGFGASDLANGCFRNPGQVDFRKGWEEIGHELERLVTKEDYASLSRGTQYAHYTPERLVRAMWSGLRRLGFKGGRVVEPGIGTGLFASLMPDEFQDRTHVLGIEADPVTARIAGLLHPESEIRNEDFGLTRMPKHFTLAVGNPPFSPRIVRTDANYRTMGLPLHDFFIVKAIDHLVPGGLAAFVSSQGTLDKANPRIRQHIARSADLLGAIRMPEGTFAATAGTQVGVDILFFRKRKDDDVGNGVLWTDTVCADIDGHDEIEINEYFSSRPHMVLGTNSAVRGQHGPEPVYACKADKTRDFDTDLANAIGWLPQDVSDCDPTILDLSQTSSVDIASNDNQRLREGSYFVSDTNVLMQVLDGVATIVQVKGKRSDPGIYAKHARLIRALIPIRDAVRAILGKQERHESSTLEQQNLNELYDAFVDAHGPINKTDITVHTDETTQAKTEQHRQANLLPFRDDPDCWLVASIEDYAIDTHTASKGLIFTGTVIAREIEPTINSAGDALARCLHEHGHVDLGYMANLVSKSEDDVLAELDTTLYRDPATGEWQTSDQYLSGKVRDKLRQAVEASAKDESYTRNINALEAVLPTDIPPSDITARLGAPWIPTTTLMTFINDIMEVKTKVSHVPAVAAWSVDERPFHYAASTNAKWGTTRYPAVKVVLDALNSRTPVIYDEWVENGTKKREINSKETEAAKEKLAALRTAFEGWVWKDGHRADTLARLYNDNYNNIVARRFDGSHLKLPGASASFTFYGHQKNAIWRMISGGSTYIAHAVGAGKTASIAAAIMEQRRLGLITKAVLTVPGHCLAQCAREFLALYPMAKILVADEQNFAKDKRRRFLGRAATGDWDAIIITHSAFKFIPLPVEFERRMMEDLVAEYEDLISNVDSDDRLTRKKLERMKETFKARLEGMKSRKDDFLTMSELGIDQIIVDEAQEFRKLSFSTNQTSLKGVDSDGSQMAWDLFSKSKFVRELRLLNAGGYEHTVDRALNLASGTPITNTLGEMYTVQRYMDIDTLRERNLHEFDAWSAAFGETRTDLELQPSGRYKPVTRFSEFVNVPELIAMFRAFADVVTAEELKKLVKRPRVQTGKRQIVTAPPSPLFKAYQKVMDQRIQAIEARKGAPKPGDDILLSVITDGRHAAIDLRFVLPGCEDEPTNKLNKMIDNIYAIHLATTDRVYLQPDGRPYERTGATQMIFSDLGTLSVEKSRGFSAYRWIKDQLVLRGVAPEEIAFVQDYKGSQAKNRLFADMRAGKVRITIGSTKKMGTGVNAQNRMIALHHLDVPWLPSDIEQREGRIDRQGNQNGEIGIFAYATEGSMDATMWQANERKAKFINAALSGDRSIRRLEDIGEDSVNQFAMAKAIASGDPRLMQKAGLESEISRLDRLRSAHYDEQHNLRSKIRNAEREIERSTKKAAALKIDIAQRGPMDAPFVMTVNGADFTDKKEAGKALTTAMRDLDFRATKLDTNGLKNKVIGQIRGFNIVYSTRWMADNNFTNSEIHTSGLVFEINTRSNTPGAVAVNQIEDVITSLENVLLRQERNVLFQEDQIQQLQSSVGLEFALEGELTLKRDLLDEINSDLAKTEEAKDENETLLADANASTDTDDGDDDADDDGDDTDDADDDDVAPLSGSQVLYRQRDDLAA